MCCGKEYELQVVKSRRKEKKVRGKEETENNDVFRKLKGLERK